MADNGYARKACEVLLQEECPIPGGGLTWAEGGVETPYGKIHTLPPGKHTYESEASA